MAIVTEEIYIKSNLDLNSHMWLAPTVLESAGLEETTCLLDTQAFQGHTERWWAHRSQWGRMSHKCL